MVNHWSNGHVHLQWHRCLALSRFRESWTRVTCAPRSGRWRGASWIQRCSWTQLRCCLALMSRSWLRNVVGYAEAWSQHEHGTRILAYWWSWVHTLLSQGSRHSGSQRPRQRGFLWWRGVSSRGTKPRRSVAPWSISGRLRRLLFGCLGGHHNTTRCSQFVQTGLKKST